MADWEERKVEGCKRGCDVKRTTSLVRRHSSVSSGTWSMTSDVGDAQAPLGKESVLGRSSAGSQRSAISRKSAGRTSAKSHTSTTVWTTAVSTASALSNASAASRKSAISSGSAVNQSKFTRPLHRRHTAPDIRRSGYDTDSTSGCREWDSDDGDDVTSDASSVPDITRKSKPTKSARREIEIDEMVHRLIRPTIASRARSALSAPQRERILQMARRKKEAALASRGRKSSPSDDGDYKSSGRFLGSQTVTRSEMDHIVARLYRDRGADRPRHQASAALINSKVGIFASYYNLGCWVHRKLDCVPPAVTERVISYCRSRIRDLDVRQTRPIHSQPSVA